MDRAFPAKKGDGRRNGPNGVRQGKRPPVRSMKKARSDRWCCTGPRAPPPPPPPQPTRTICRLSLSTIPRHGGVGLTRGSASPLQGQDRHDGTPPTRPPPATFGFPHRGTEHDPVTESHPRRRTPVRGRTFRGSRRFPGAPRACRVVVRAFVPWRPLLFDGVAARVPGDCVRG
jgi:hypothetical protein